jgi:hypothetical protein
VHPAPTAHHAAPAATTRRLQLVHALCAAFALSACSAGAKPTAMDAGAPRDAGRDAATDACAALFGAPNAQTGLDETQCRPVCGCGDAPFVPRAWDAASLAALRAKVLLGPPAALTDDPYTRPAPPPAPPGSVCAVRFDAMDANAYTLETFASREAATAAGAFPTHAGACGLCSSLADLAVYAGTPDLTAPVRQCGLDHATDPAGLRACLAALGFTPPCAEIWAYNVEHTRSVCGSVCLRLLRAPYHTPDGALNACLQCDETESGDVFKAVAGRTRRNTGLANALCRPCSEVVPFDHAYPGI